MQHLTPPIYSHNKVLLTTYCRGLLLSKRQQTRLKLQFGSVFSYQGKNVSFFSICGIAPVLLNQIFAFIGPTEAFKNACGGAFLSKIISNSLKILLKMSSFTYIFQRF